METPTLTPFALLLAIGSTWTAIPYPTNGPQKYFYDPELYIDRSPVT